MTSTEALAHELLDEIHRAVAAGVRRKWRRLMRLLVLMGSLAGLVALGLQVWDLFVR